MADPAFDNAMNMLPPEDKGIVYQPPQVPPPVAPPQQQPNPNAPVDMTPRLVGVVNTPSRKAALSKTDKTVLGSMGQQLANTAAAGEVQAELGNQAADAYAKAAQVDQEMLDNQQRAQDDINKTLQERESQLQADMDELNKHSVSPRDFSALWAEKSTGQKIMAGIGMALSSMGRSMSTLAAARLGDAGAFSRFKSPIEDYVTSAIEQDVRKQQAKHDMLSGRVSGDRTMMNDYSKTADARLDNMDRLRIISFEKTKKLVESLKARMQSAEQIAAADDMVEKLTQKQALTYQEMMARAQRAAAGAQKGLVQVGNQYIAMPVDKALKLQNDQREFALKEGAQAIDREQLNLKQKQFAQETQQGLPVVPGLKRTGNAASPLSSQEVKELRSQAALVKDQLRMMDRALEIANDKSLTDSKKVVMGRILQQRLKASERKAQDMGVPSVWEDEQVSAIIPNPNDRFSPRAAETYRALIQEARAKAGQYFGTYGYDLEDAASDKVQKQAAPSSNRVFKKE